MKKIILFAGFLLLAAAAYTGYDLSQARSMVAQVCSRAHPGTLVSAFLSTIDQGAFKVIAAEHRTVIVSRSGMGRYHCTITHNGTTISNAAPGFLD